MKKKLFGKKNNLVLDYAEDPNNGSGQPEHQDSFLQSNFTKLEGDQLKFIKENISITTSGITHRPKKSIDRISGEVEEEEIKNTISLDDIEIGEIVGKGSAGLVYKGKHKRLNQLVAIKCINIYDKEKRKQLLNDLKSLTALSNPDPRGGLAIPCDFLVNFHGGFLDEGTVKVVLEFMDKGTLRDLIKKKMSVSEQVLCVIAIQILNGLAYLHTVSRQAHLDIKPENILINSTGYVKLSDFGISKGFDESQHFMKTFIGTMNYMSPERIMSTRYNQSSDIWSFGLTILEVFTGEFPLTSSKSFIEIFQYFKNTDNYEPNFASKDCSDAFKDFIRSTLRKDPRKRPSAIELLTHPWIRTNFGNSSRFKHFIDSL